MLHLQVSGISIASELLDNCIHINRVPEDNEVDDETQGVELILLSPSIMLLQFASFAMENNPR